MKVVASAGPRTRLQLVRYRVDEVGTADKRFQVRYVADTGIDILGTSSKYKPARQLFDMEADWRGLELRQAEDI